MVEVWVVVEMYAGLPESVRIAKSEKDANAMAMQLAEDLGYELAEDGRYWVRGDSELHIREVEL